MRRKFISKDGTIFEFRIWIYYSGSTISCYRTDRYGSYKVFELDRDGTWQQTRVNLFDNSGQAINAVAHTKYLPPEFKNIVAEEQWSDYHNRFSEPIKPIRDWLILKLSQVDTKFVTGSWNRIYLKV